VLEVVARAADVTEPQALLDLRDRLDADVSLVIGRDARAFHPKLWLIEKGDALLVLAGSGNLTAAGLTTNDEQFDLIALENGSDDAVAHVDRFALLTRNALPLEQVVDTAIWHEWLAVFRRQAQLRSQLADAERNLREREPMPDRAVHKAMLIEDLQKIYDETVAANLPRQDGQQYYPTRLLVAINRARDGQRDPVALVTDVLRYETKGFDVLLAAARVDLTLEYLVLDPSRQYHDVFKTRTLELARERVAMFPQAT
jgi:hypothetical protein